MGPLLDIHPRLSANAACGWTNDFSADLAMWDEIGVRRVGVWENKFEAHGHAAAVDAIQARGLVVTSFVTQWFDLSNSVGWPRRRDGMCAAIDTAVELGAGCVYVPPGPSDGRSWEQLLEALVEAIEPCVRHAATRGMRLAFEPSARTQVSFVNTLRDAIVVTDHVAVDVVVDFASCWMERELAVVLAALGSRIALVQVADVGIGGLRRPDDLDVRAGPSGRVVPGEGDLDLDRLIRATISAGYGGPFELELLGPSIEAEGYSRALRRGLIHVSEILEGSLR
jgi:sugar phosphate isomerase/epimerase